MQAVSVVNALAWVGTVLTYEYFLSMHRSGQEWSQAVLPTPAFHGWPRYEAAAGQDAHQKSNYTRLDDQC